MANNLIMGKVRCKRNKKRLIKEMRQKILKTLHLKIAREIRRVSLQNQIKRTLSNLMLEFRRSTLSRRSVTSKSSRLISIIDHQYKLRMENSLKIYKIKL
jgi:hypothetical protein